MKSKIIHLNYIWPTVMTNTTSFAGMCGMQNLHRGQVTNDKSKITCPRCSTAAATNSLTALDATRAAPAKAKAPVRARGGRGMGKAWPWPPGAKLHLLTQINPVRPGSAKHTRWAMMFTHDDKSWEEFKAAGGNLETLQNAILQKVVEVK